jgi:hypothetical protein
MNKISSRIPCVLVCIAAVADTTSACFPCHAEPVVQILEYEGALLVRIADDSIQVDGNNSDLSVLQNDVWIKDA